MNEPMFHFGKLNQIYVKLGVLEWGWSKKPELMEKCEGCSVELRTRNDAVGVLHTPRSTSTLTWSVDQKPTYLLQKACDIEATR